MAIEALNKKLFKKVHLETHIVYELQRSSKQKAAIYFAEVFKQKDGVLRIAELIGDTGSDSTNGPFFQINEKNLSELIDLNLLKKEALKIDLIEQPVKIQAVIKGILDGKKYYLRDGALGDKW